eukprot:6756599-Heterocapsa_arctica.AAC.1
MEENLEVTRQTKEMCKDLLQEAQAVAEDTKHMDSEKEKQDKKDKVNKEIAEAHLLYHSQADRDKGKQEAEAAADRKDKLDKEKAEQEAQNKQEEKEEVKNMMDHKNAEKLAPWITGMTEEHMMGI